MSNNIKNLIIILLITITGICLYFGLIYNHQIGNVNLQLKFSDNIATANPKTIQHLESILKKYNTAVKKDELIVILEDQRNYFIGMITILSIMIGLFGLFNVVQRYLDKDLENELKKALSDSEKEIEKLKIQRIIHDLYIITQYFEDPTFVPGLEDGTLVTNLQQFKIAVIEQFTEFFNINSKEHLDDFHPAFFNYVNGSIKYAKNQQWIKICYNSKNNELLAFIFNTLYAKCGKEEYILIKKAYINNMKKVCEIDAIIE